MLGVEDDKINNNNNISNSNSYNKIMLVFISWDIN